MSAGPPLPAIRGRHAAAATADGLATQAAMWTFARGGNAVDAALAANAAMAVVAPHLCGIGGDLFAIVRTPSGEVLGLDASGSAGSGSDAGAMRAEGLRQMPLRHDVRSVTVPGCVDGWMLLHERLGSLPFGEIVVPAIRLAATGAPASPLLCASLALLDDDAAPRFVELAEQASEPGAIVRRPGVALTLQAIVRGGRDAFYGGAFGEGLLELGGGVFDADDLDRIQARWVPVLTEQVFGHQLHTVGPPSQGYLALAIAGLVQRVALPGSPDDVERAHLFVEAVKAASFDRPDVLHDDADGADLLARAVRRAGTIDADRAAALTPASDAGDTTYLCTADDRGWAVSLIQSNASGFGSWLVEPTTGINLHNRGLGFSLAPGHPAELTAGRRPPHTLVPALATRDGAVRAVLGSAGGDAQPAIVAQLATRLLYDRATAAEAVAAPRVVLRGPSTGFDTWDGEVRPTVVIEDHAPPAWPAILRERGHLVETAPAFGPMFGHAHCITVDADGLFEAAADPRTVVGTAAAL